MDKDTTTRPVAYTAPRIQLLGTVAEMTAFTKTAGSADGWQQLQA